MDPQIVPPEKYSNPYRNESNAKLVKIFLLAIDDLTDPENHQKVAMRAIEAQDIRQDLWTFEDQFRKLKVLEKWIVAQNRIYEEEINYTGATIYGLKTACLFTWSVAIAVSILLVMHFYYSGERISSYIVWTADLLLLGYAFFGYMVTSVALQPDLLIDESPVTTSPRIIDYEDMSAMKYEYLVSIMKGEQKRLINCYCEDVLPLNRRYKRNTKQHLKFLRLAYIPIYVYHLGFSAYLFLDLSYQGYAVVLLVFTYHEKLNFPSQTVKDIECRQFKCPVRNVFAEHKKRATVFAIFFFFFSCVAL
ncbi:hypothetical protein CAEBREN_06903 [Caenorhabditis brenneri]|uniref:Uncharacterized protein n=1 Tax=Caenorhabditis brenneri TaxID=135651 RepID=G0MBR8_CAEBE|nr:hypothetical protein CAEBREN_06903 [Caenorhabditis brenneri]